METELKREIKRETENGDDSNENGDNSNDGDGQDNNIK